jgi:putative transposase
MAAEKAHYGIARMARLLEVSRSGYYDWANRQTAGPTPAQQRRAALTDKIRTFHADSDGVYGSPRILADLREAGDTVSAKTVAKLMRRNAIVGISPRKFIPVTTIPGPDPHRLPDLVKGCFDHGVLNKVWISDITYLGTDEGWLYLCAIRDGCSRRAIGWQIADHLRADLVQDALTMAVTMRGNCPTRSCSTPTAAPNTPPPRSPRPPPTSASCSRSGAPACAGTTPPPSRFGRP